MTKRDIFAFLFRYKNTILGWWLFVVLLVTVLTYALPQSYLARGSVLVERTKAPLLSTGEFRAPEMTEAMNTELQIVRSRPVLEAVVDRLKLDAPRDEAPAKQGLVWLGEAREVLSAFLLEQGLTDELPPREAWIEDLDRRLGVDPVVDSNVLSITYSSKNPDLAMRVVNAVTDAYMVHRRSIYSSRGASAYYRSKMEEAARELDRLRDALSDFKARNAVSALEDSKTQLVRDMGALRERLAVLRAERADLMSRFAQNHPRVAVATQNIRAAERDFDARLRELQELESRQSTIDDLTVLIGSQEVTFLDYKTRFEQERAQESAPENLVNARIIEYAALPAKPSRSRLFYIKVALAGGLVLALLIAFIREYFSQRIDGPEEAELALGVPVVGSVPRTRSARRI